MKPGPGPAWRKRSGAVLLAQDGFETGGRAAFWTGDGKVAARYDPTVPGVFLYQSTIKHSGTYAARSYVTTDEDQPCKFELVDTQWANLMGALCTEIYFEWWNYFPSPGYTFPVGSQKLMRVGHYDAGFLDRAKSTDLMIQTTNTELTFVFYNQPYGGAQNREFAYRNYTPIVTNTWIKWGIYLKLNTPGQSNGIYQCYKDDVLLLGATGLNLTDDANGLNYLWIGGNYTNQGVVTGNHSHYIDDIKIYNKKPPGL